MLKIILPIVVGVLFIITFVVGGVWCRSATSEGKKIYGAGFTMILSTVGLIIAVLVLALTISSVPPEAKDTTTPRDTTTTSVTSATPAPTPAPSDTYSPAPTEHGPSIAPAISSTGFSVVPINSKYGYVTGSGYVVDAYGNEFNADYAYTTDYDADGDAWADYIVDGKYTRVTGTLSPMYGMDQNTLVSFEVQVQKFNDSRWINVTPNETVLITSGANAVIMDVSFDTPVKYVRLIANCKYRDQALLLIDFRFHE